MVLVKKAQNKPRFNSMFDEFFHSDFPAVFNREFSKTPSVNVIESKESYKLEVAAPGFTKENIKVSIEDNMLTISGEIKTEKEETEEKYTRKEFGYNSFSRSFTIPDTVHADQIKGNYQNGILTVVLPKLEEVKGVSKQIDIS